MKTDNTIIIIISISTFILKINALIHWVQCLILHTKKKYIYLCWRIAVEYLCSLKIFGYTKLFCCCCEIVLPKFFQVRKIKYDNYFYRDNKIYEIWSCLLKTLHYAQFSRCFLVSKYGKWYFRHKILTRRFLFF